MLFYRAALDLSHSAHAFVADLIRLSSVAAGIRSPHDDGRCL